MVPAALLFLFCCPFAPDRCSRPPPSPLPAPPDPTERRVLRQPWTNPTVVSPWQEERGRERGERDREEGERAGEYGGGGGVKATNQTDRTDLTL